MSDPVPITPINAVEDEVMSLKSEKLNLNAPPKDGASNMSPDYNKTNPSPPDNNISTVNKKSPSKNLVTQVVVGEKPLIKADLELIWKDVLIKTKPQRKGCCKKNIKAEKTLLHNISGRARAGECLAILGSSGAGKTTLLNFLSKKIETDNLTISGQVTLNGEDISTDKFNIISSYVMQDDILEATMTPVEILLFTAKLKYDLPPEEIEMKVKNMIDALNLKKCQNTKIGNAEIRGVSGGERKRTSIGVELISDPKVLFLDEPTTGLDSYNAYELIDLLEKLAKKGKIIIFTIHQPSSEIFLLLDKICILAQGRTVYFGPRVKAMDCFASFGLPVPENYNPFEHFMEVTNVTSVQEDSVVKAFPQLAEIPDTHQRYETYVEELNKKYEESKDTYIDRTPEIKGFSEENEEMFRHKETQVGVFYQFGLLYARSIIVSNRNPKVLFLKVIQAIFSAALMAIIFMRLSKEFSGIQDRLGVVLNCIAASILVTASSVLLTFIDEKRVFTRERSNRLYNTLAYYLSKLFTDLPIIFIANCLFGLLVHLATELNDTYSHKYYSFLGILVLLGIGGLSYGYFIGNLGNHTETLVLLNTAFCIPLMLLSGFFADSDNFAPYLIPFKYISIFKFGFQALTHIEFSDSPAFYCENIMPEICAPKFTRFTYFEPFYVSMIAIGALIVTFQIIAFVCMYYLAKIKV